MSDSSQPQHGSNPPGSHYQPALSVVLIIVVLFVASAFLMLRYVSPAGTVTTTTLPPSQTTTTTGHPAVSKATVRVQVANGTTRAGLARAYTQELQTRGWDTLPQENVIGPNVKVTSVYFNPGFKWAATQIANMIHVKLRDVVPLNGLRPAPGASSDDVVLILGPDAPNIG
jgi:hypothetical protein